MGTVSESFEKLETPRPGDLGTHNRSLPDGKHPCVADLLRACLAGPVAPGMCLSCWPLQLGPSSITWCTWLNKQRFWWMFAKTVFHQLKTVV